MRADLTRQAEQLLENTIQDPHLVRHAAETQAQLLAWRMPATVQLGALVLPLLADGTCNGEEIIARFGRRPLQIARIALQFSVGRVTSKPSTPRQFALTLRDLYRCAYIDIETALVCAANRVASTTQVDDMPPPERQTWGMETLAVDVPFFEMLGMWTLHQSMANLALALIDDAQYIRYERYIDTYYQRHEPAFQQIVKQLGTALDEQGFQNALIQMHETTPGNLYKREQRALTYGKRYDPTQVGPLRVDILLDTVPDCYRAMGVIHHLWPPSTAHPIRDEIAAPRYNGYRVLATTVTHGPGSHPIEFRLLTHDIHRVNLHGVTIGEAVPGAWWCDNDLADQAGIRETRGLDDNICGFTLSGEVVYPLRRGATLVDFAFKVDADLAPYARKFIVNGEPKPFRTEIRHRDLIAIEYDQSYESLTPEWEAAARAQTTREHIQRHKENKVAAIHQGRAAIDTVLERECEIYNMRFSPEQVEGMLRAAVTDYGLPSLGVLYARVAGGSISPDDIVAGMIERDLASHVLILDDAIQDAAPEIIFARDWMQLPDPDRYRHENRITPRAEIIGQFDNSVEPPTLTVYRANSPQAPSRRTAVPLSWGHDADTNQEALQIVVVSTRRQGVPWAVLNEVHRAAREAGETLLVYRLQAEAQQETTQVDMTINLSSPEVVTNLQKNLRALQHNKLIRSFRLWQLFPGERIYLARRTTRRYNNPFHVRRVREEAMFFGRENEIQDVVDFIHRDVPFIIIHGHKRIGKTSLMYHLAEHILPDACPHIIPIVFNAQEAAPINAYSFAEIMLSYAEEAVLPHLRRPEDKVTLDMHNWDLRHRPLNQILKWVEQAETILKGKRLYFMIDEFTALYEAHAEGELSLGFFQRLDAILDQSKIMMLLCLHDHVLREMRVRSQNMNQRSEFIPIRELDETAARALIREPLHQLYTFADGIEDRIMRLTNAHPYYIHILCGELVQQLQKSNQTHITPDILRFAVVKVLDSSFQRFAAYRSTTDKLGLDTLRAIAILSGENNKHWAPIDKIRQHVIRYQREYGEELDPRDVQRSIEELNRTGITRKQIDQQTRKATYKIAVGLMHIWLLKGTHRVPEHLT